MYIEHSTYIRNIHILPTYFKRELYFARHNRPIYGNVDAHLGHKISSHIP